PSARSAIGRLSSSACGSPRVSRRGAALWATWIPCGWPPPDAPNGRWAGSEAARARRARTGPAGRRRSGGARSVPAAAPLWRERIFLLLLGLRRGDRDPAPRLHAFLVERSLGGALGPVALEIFPGVLLVELHPFT